MGNVHGVSFKTTFQPFLPEAVHVNSLAGFIFSLIVLLEADLPMHIQAKLGRPGLYKWPEDIEHMLLVKTQNHQNHMPNKNINQTTGNLCDIISDNLTVIVLKHVLPVKEISVVSDKNVWLGLMDMFKPSLNERGLQADRKGQK